MKLPVINVKPVGEFQSGNLPQPDYMSQAVAAGDLGGAIGDLAVHINNEKIATELSEATGKAASELSELRAKLESSNSLDVTEIPEGISFRDSEFIDDGAGGRQEIPRARIFTHEVADEMWARGSQEIINNYSEGISSNKARAKFAGEMDVRYVAPGSLAIGKASIARSRAHSQAIAESTIDEIAAANAPTAMRESQMREVIARQVLMGASPDWAARQLAVIGPQIDQIDTQNALMKAQGKDAIAQIEEEMWTNGNRMSAEQMRTLSVQADKMVRDIDRAEDEAKVQNAEDLTVVLIDPDQSLTLSQIASELADDRITREVSMILSNALTKGSSTKASNPFTLSVWRGKIAKLPYTGNNSLVTSKAAFMKLSINMASMGLNPNGTPTGLPATISGEDAFILMKDIDAKVKLALKTPQYNDAWQMIKTHSRIVINPLTQIMEGTQAQRDAAILFKQALDTYMDQYGIDAKPIDFFNTNRDKFDPTNFEGGINRQFHDKYPFAREFMTIPLKRTEEITFDEEQQRQFIIRVKNGAMDGSLDPELANEMAAQFFAFYRGKGQAPGDGELMLEVDNPLYHQFEVQRE